MTASISAVSFQKRRIAMSKRTLILIAGNLITIGFFYVADTDIDGVHPHQFVSYLLSGQPSEALSSLKFPDRGITGSKPITGGCPARNPSTENVAQFNNPV